MAVNRSYDERKFDRQMRLWGPHGQRAIREAHVAVLGAGPAATETLKNLVLPNVGNFTLIDDQKVTARDCGNNFFVTQDDVGKARAIAVTEALLEMNPAVNGTAVEKAPVDVINSEIESLGKYNLVIATQVYGKSHRKLAAFLYEREIPYINVRINGMIGALRVAIPELRVIESHPTDDRTDFYIYPEQLANFRELQEYVDSFDINTQDVKDKAHLPCVALLGQYTRLWKESHEGKLPQGFKEQQEFKSGLFEYGEGENIFDADRWAFQCYNRPRIHFTVQRVLNDPKGETIEEKSPDFWVMVRALKDFMAKEGAGFMPVSTNIPDITADSKSYVRLKQIYKDRAARDLELIRGYVKARLQEIGRAPEAIPDEIVERFVKNARNLTVVRLRSVEEEFTNPDKEFLTEQYEAFDINALMGEQRDDDEKPFNPKGINWYFANRMVDEFFDKNGRVPGEDASTVAEDTAQLVALQTELFKGIGLEQEVVREVLAEIARFGGAELHNTGAFVGGVASQAALKLLLNQFFPFNHTYLYNGIFCSGNVFAV